MTPILICEMQREVTRMIDTQRKVLVADMEPGTRSEREARVQVLEAIAAYLQRPPVTVRQIELILERQQIEASSCGIVIDAGIDTRILSIATTAEAIKALFEGRSDE